MKYKLRDLVKVINGYPFSSEAMNNDNNGLPVIKIKEMKNKGVLITKDTLFHQYNSTLEQFILKRNDVIVALTGNPANKPNLDAMVGRCSIYKYSFPALINQRVCKIESKSNLLNNLFLYYFLSQDKITIELAELSTGSANQANISSNDLLNLEIDLPNLEIQQHIVDTIGSVDDLIENIEEKSQRVKKYGNKLFSKIRLNNLESLLNKVSFSKGKEIGSLNYLDKQIDDSVPYIRVGDLPGGSFDTFTTSKDVPLCNEEDILITFDGAPGRNNYGLKGAISSGIQKVVCKQKIKGFIYFYINSDLCQNTIQSNAQGTTILHASKAIKELKIPVIEDDNVYQKFNDLFSYLIVLSKEKTVLQKQKQLLLQKYFG